jgi:hypothetical protein
MTNDEPELVELLKAEIASLEERIEQLEETIEQFRGLGRVLVAAAILATGWGVGPSRQDRSRRARP